MRGICGLPMNTNPRLKWRTAFRRHLLVVILQQVQLLGRNIRFGGLAKSMHGIEYITMKKAVEPHIDRTNKNIETSKSLAARVTMKTTCDCHPPGSYPAAASWQWTSGRPSSHGLSWRELKGMTVMIILTGAGWWIISQMRFIFGWWFLDTFWMLNWNSPWVGACVWCSSGEDCKRTLPTLESGRPPSLPTPGRKLDGHKAGWDVWDLHGTSAI